MRRELPLLGGFAAVVLAAALLAVLVPGAFAPPPDEPERPGIVDLQEMSISHGTVGGETVPLSVEARLQHRGPPSENVTVLFRAVGRDSGLVETTRTVDVGTVDGDREFPVTTNLTVAREGGYRIEAVVFADDRRLTTGSTTVSGLSALTPAYADTAVDVHRFGAGRGALPSIEYTVDRAGEDRTTLNVSTYLTNRGDGPSEDVRVVLKARQADSNIVADQAVIRVGQIPPGQTATPSAELTVPSQYNYYLDAVLWKDGVIVTNTRSAANLDPTRTIRVNETREDVGLEVGDFERDGGSGAPRDRPEATEAASGQGPGFGVGAALAALLVGLLALARRGDSQ